MIGLGLYLLTVLVSMKSLWAIYRSASHPMTHYLSLVGLCMLPAYLVCMGFDNVLNYVLPAAQFPFAFTGAAIGLCQVMKQPGPGFHTDEEQFFQDWFASRHLQLFGAWADSPSHRGR